MSQVGGYVSAGNVIGADFSSLKDVARFFRGANAEFISPLQLNRVGKNLYIDQYTKNFNLKELLERGLEVDGNIYCSRLNVPENKVMELIRRGIKMASKIKFGKF